MQSLYLSIPSYNGEIKTFVFALPSYMGTIRIRLKECEMLRRMKLEIFNLKIKNKKSIFY